MRREFTFFDQEVIEKEFDALTDSEQAKLATLMDYYEQVGLIDPAPVKIDDYGGGIKRLRHIKPAYQGRVLFYVAQSTRDYQELIVLTVFKKESQDVPKHVLERARVRKDAFEGRRRINE